MSQKCIRACKNAFKIAIANFWNPINAELFASISKVSAELSAKKKATKSQKRIGNYNIYVKYWCAEKW